MSLFVIQMNICGAPALCSQALPTSTAVNAGIREELK